MPNAPDSRLCDEQYDRLMRKARQTNAWRDRADRANGFAAPVDTPGPVLLGTVAAAIECGVRMQDWNNVAEGLAMAEDWMAAWRKATA